MHGWPRLQASLAMQSHLGEFIQVYPRVKRNPDSDIQPTEDFAVGRPDHQTATCSVHLPSGLTVSRIDSCRLQLLYNAFTSTARAGTLSTDRGGLELACWLELAAAKQGLLYEQGC